MVPQGSEMDVSRVDPEDVLVDWQTVEPGDVSGELDENWFGGIDHGKEDKVMVSIRRVVLHVLPHFDADFISEFVPPRCLQLGVTPLTRRLQPRVSNFYLNTADRRLRLKTFILMKSLLVLKTSPFIMLLHAAM
jgi:hypothetical protein